jgi:hypothetical protein
MEAKLYAEIGQQAATTLKSHYGKPLAQLGAQKCNSEPMLCPFETIWQGQFKGIPSFHIPDYRPMYQRDERAWQTDLNSIQYERSIETGMYWDPYRFMDGRQMHTQYCNSDFVAGKDQYMRQVHSLETSKLVQPQFECARW